MAYRRRPFVATDNGTDLIVENLYVGHLKDIKAIHITPSWEVSPGLIATYKSVSLRNVATEDVQRTVAGLHIDHMFLDGGRDKPVSFLLQDIAMEGITTA